MEPVNGMNLWKITTQERVKPPPYKKPPGRPPGKKRMREKGEPKEKGKMCKVGLVMHCRNCGQEGHNKTKCLNASVAKAKKPPGRPRKHPIRIESTTSSQVQIHQPSQVQSQPTECPRRKKSTDRPTSISQALPKRKPGRPRFGCVSSSQEASRQEPVYDTAPIQIPREGYGLFTSRLTGDDYISVGSRVTDTRDNTILPSHLYGARERKKMAACGRGQGKN